MTTTCEWWNLAALVCVARNQVVSPARRQWLTSSTLQMRGFPPGWSPDMRAALDRMEAAGNIHTTVLSYRALLTEQGMHALIALLPAEQLREMGRIEYVPAAKAS